VTPAETRRSEILAKLEADGGVRVGPLAQLFGVSEVTIRSDLTILARQGRLRRVHGGGLRRGGGDSGLDQHVRRHSRPQRWIAERAAVLIEDGDVVFVDGSPIGLLIAQRLYGRRDVTVVTNSIPVGRVAADGVAASVVLLGGALRPGSSATVPDAASAGVAGARIGRAFVAADALSFEDGLALADVALAGSLRELLDAAPEVIALVESTAFARLGGATVLGLDRVSCVFVDERVAPEHLARLQQRGVPVTICGEHRSTHVPAAAAPGRRWKIGFANVSEEIQMAVRIRRSIERAAAAAGTVDLMLADNRIDGPTSLRNAERFIDAGVDLVINYFHLARYGDIISSRLRTAGIPVISVNASMAGTRYFGVDNYLVGRMGGAAAGRAAAARWGRRIDRVIVVSLLQANENTVARMYAQLEALRELVDAPDERVDQLAILPVRAEARAAVETLLAAHAADRRIVVLCTNDDSALGAADALRAAGRDADAVVVGQGGASDGREALADPTSPIVATVSYHPERYGDQVIPYALDILEGRLVPPAIIVEAELLERTS
jgi:ribose transport system substrate-binding protein